MQQLGQVAAVVEDHVGVPWLAILEDGLLQAPLVLFLGFTFPGEYRDAGSGDGGGGLVLGGEDVAGRPAHFGAEGDQGLDQHRGLDGHVDAAEDLGTLQRLLGRVLVAQAHQGRHLGFGDDDLATAPSGQFDVGNLVIGKSSAHAYLHS
ncbi:hypothetical protein D3C81_1321140 [compost metagenome]